MYAPVTDFTILAELNEDTALGFASTIASEEFRLEWIGHLESGNLVKHSGIHFARLALIPGLEGEGNSQLLLSAVVDTSFQTNDLPEIWFRLLSLCVDFPTDPKREEHLSAWLAAGRLRTKALYVAAVGESASSIIHSKQLKDSMKSLEVSPASKDEVESFVTSKMQEYRDQPFLGRLVNRERSTILQRRLNYRLKAAFTLTAAWGALSAVVFLTDTGWQRPTLATGCWAMAISGGMMVFVLIIWAAILHVLGRKLDTAADWGSHRDSEDQWSESWRQNSYTLLFEIRDSRLARLSLSLYLKLANLLIVIRYQHGRLTGVGSIHFARFYLLANGRQMLFLSDFDGSSRHYLAEFTIIGKLAVVPIVMHLRGAPKTRVLFQLNPSTSSTSRFSTFIHKHRLADISASSYSSLSVANVLDNRQFRNAWLKDNPRAVIKLLAKGQATPARKDGPLDCEDIQGLLGTGFAHLSASRFLLLHFDTPQSIASLLKKLVVQVTTIEMAAQNRASGKTTPCVNVAITASGLELLGVDLAESEIPLAFLAGTSCAKQQQRVGDVRNNGPQGWHWGAKHQKTIHFVVMIYARTSEDLNAVQRENQLASHPGCSIMASLDSNSLSGGREHFGFKDGISQPVLNGMPEQFKNRDSLEADRVPPGEFLLGHKNLDGEFSPRVRLVQNANEIINQCENGTFLVLRQLEQDVEAFWKQCASDKNFDPVHIASKIVGRKPDGEPLVASSDRNQNSFTYKGDPDGLACPIGAHIRRTNPRDSLLNRSQDSGFIGNFLRQGQSSRFVNRHRILRRGRPYGPVGCSEWYPSTVDPPHPVQSGNADSDAKSEPRGLYFVCLNADIDKQFEFIQASWMNSPKFGGLDDEIDVLAGQQSDSSTANFTIPGPPISHRITNINRFVRVRGSEYFLLPGIQTLKWLAGISRKKQGPEN